MNLVRILDHMESEGWLERRADPADRRARQLFLKPKSTPAVEAIWIISDVVRDEAFAGISLKQARELVSLLEKVHANVLALAPLPVIDSGPRASAGSDKTSNSRAQRARTVVKS